MDYISPSKFINIKKFDAVVSFGIRCSNTMVLRKLKIYRESFPFDSIPTTPTLVLKYLKDQTDFYPKQHSIHNVDGVSFGHFNTNEKYEETIKTFKRRFNRLFSLLTSKKKILFVFSNEHDIYINESRLIDYHNLLVNIVNYIKEEYKYDNFKILAIHTNKTFVDSSNIINFTINITDKYLSDTFDKHKDYGNVYRTVLEELMKEIFQISS